MITNRKFLMMLLLFISCSIHVIAQTDYYYYQGKKIPLTQNENKVIVSILKESDETIKSIRANVKVLDTIRDDFFDIFIISRSDFEKITKMDIWAEDAKSVIVTSSYYIELYGIYYEGFSTPYLIVQLKREQDIDLLSSYVERYALRIVKQDSFMPLWYVLSITPETGKSPLEIANTLWESEKFAASEPDFASDMLLDQTPIRSITTVTPKESSRIFDLQGRKLSSKPARGIYIEDGKKKVKW